MTGFLYPNEAAIEWDLLIVIYPYITGLVAGAFIVSSLYHVFGLTKLKPVARFSLVTALAFLLVAPMPLVLHLGRPERALEMLLRPNLVSAMSGFGYVYMFYLLLVLAETWLVFRPDIVGYARASHGFKKTLYSALCLGTYDVAPATLEADHKLIKILALIGIPTASLLHGYVGFIFGAIKANPWWSTPLMPIIFLLSAVVSGIALLLVLYVVSSKVRRVPLDYDCLHTMAMWLGGFLVIAITLEGLEVLSMLYESEESWDVIRQLITQRMTFSYLILQFGIGSLLSLVMLMTSEVSKLGEGKKTVFRIIAACLILIGVFAMRWNVVIGGQLVSKSLRGLGSFTPPVLGENGILLAVGILVAPFLILWVITHLVPPWERGAMTVEVSHTDLQRASFK